MKKVITHMEFTKIVDELKKKISQASDFKSRQLANKITENLFEYPAFWDKLDQCLAVTVNTEALENAQQFIS